MPKELRISAIITLPDGVFAEAAALCEAKPILDRLTTEFEEAAITYEVVTPKPRGEKPAAGTE